MFGNYVKNNSLLISHRSIEYYQPPLSLTAFLPTDPLHVNTKDFYKELTFRNISVSLPERWRSSQTTDRRQ